MMKLSAAASFFDRCVCTDAYGTDTFLGQLDVFDDVKKDSLGASRRVLSAAATVTTPARRTITLAGSTWLMSAPYYDQFNGETIRQKFSIQECDGLASIRTAAEALAGAGGTSAYTGMTLIKTGRVEENSTLLNRFDFFFAPGEVVAEKQIIGLGLHKYLVRSVASMPTDFVKATADQLEEPSVQAASFITRTYQPVSDTYTTSSTSCNIMTMRWSLDFAYESAASVKFSDGDVYGLVRKVDVAAARAGDTITIASEGWHILSVSDEGACWGLHLRRA